MSGDYSLWTPSIRDSQLLQKEQDKPLMSNSRQIQLSPLATARTRTMELEHQQMRVHVLDGEAESSSFTGWFFWLHYH